MPGRGRLSSPGPVIAREGAAVNAEVGVVGGGVVGVAVALELARRGAEVVVLEAEDEVGLAASGTNSGILHTGFDSEPGSLETEMILRAGALRDPVVDALGLPVLRCGAEVRPRNGTERKTVVGLAARARENGVEAGTTPQGGLAIPGEAVTDPVAFTLALAAAAERHGAEIRTGFEVSEVSREGGRLVLRSPAGERVAVRLLVNCAGLGAGHVAALAGDRSFEIYPRKGEFLVFEPPPGSHLDRILLPVPAKRTKGVLVFPSLDGKLIAGPTAVDLDEPDWTVRPEARAEILPKATAMFPPLAAAELLFSYAGLRPAGRGVNYVIERSRRCPALVNVAAIRSTGLTASLAIAERVAGFVSEAGVTRADPAPLSPARAPDGAGGPWWRRTADRLGE